MCKSPIYYGHSTLLWNLCNAHIDYLSNEIISWKNRLCLQFPLRVLPAFTQLNIQTCSSSLISLWVRFAPPLIHSPRRASLFWLLTLFFFFTFWVSHHWQMYKIQNCLNFINLVNSQSKFHSGIWSGIYTGKEFVVKFSLEKRGSILWTTKKETN